MGMFNKVSDLFKIKPRSDIKEKFYNQEEVIIDRASKGDYAYLIEARKFVENIISETFNVDNTDSLDNSKLFNLIDSYIDDINLKSKLHNLRNRANSAAHDLNTKINESNIEYDLKAIDELIDYCCFRNKKINDYELFSLIKRIEEEKKIDNDKIFSSKLDVINFENIQDLFVDDISDKYEYYTSGYNAKPFCLAIKELYRKVSRDCDPIFYVVHNILIRKDMVRKSPYLNKLDLTSSALDSVRFYEILILHSMKYGYFSFYTKNVFSVPQSEIGYVKIAYNNIMYYANILNEMKKIRLI